MANDFSGIVNADGTACVRADGAAVAGDMGGQADCVCGPCNLFLKATSCNPGNCNLQLVIYFCKNIFECTTGEPARVGTIVLYQGICYGVLNATVYSTDGTPGTVPLPANTLVLQLEDLDNECWDASMQCSDCRVLSDGYLRLVPCTCSKSSPPLQFFIHCADYNAEVQRTGFQCPVFQYQDPDNNNAIDCYKVSFADFIVDLPPNAYVFTSGGYPDCCACCGSEDGDNAGCCSCDVLTFHGSECVRTTVSYSGNAATLRITETPYGCCWSRGASLSGSGQTDFYFGPGQTHRYMNITATASGRFVTWVQTMYDPDTGAVTGMSGGNDDLGECCLFPGRSSILDFMGAGNLSPGGSLHDHSGGSVIGSCDSYSWSYTRDNTEDGGQMAAGSGSFTVVGIVGNCDPSQCGAGSGFLMYSCSSCGTIPGLPSPESFL